MEFSGRHLEDTRHLADRQGVRRATSKQHNVDDQLDKTIPAESRALVYCISIAAFEAENEAWALGRAVDGVRGRISPPWHASRLRYSSDRGPSTMVLRRFDLRMQQRSFWKRLFWPEDQSEQFRSIHTAPTEWPEAIQNITRGVNKIDRPSFRWEVFAIAALGFLTESYSLFESNVILLPLSYVYWTGHNNTLETTFNLVTLGASIIGQLSFGLAVDVYGRRSLWGLELVVVIVATLGLLQCSVGFVGPTGHTTWSITPWLLFWRIVMGIGIGAEYPLSAIIASEWSPTVARAQVMASVFLMQPLGQCLAYGIGLLCLLDGNTAGYDQLSADRFWRVIVGAGAVPAVIAYIFRRSIPESWRFDYFVKMTTARITHDHLYDPHGMRTPRTQTDALEKGAKQTNAGSGTTAQDQATTPRSDQQASSTAGRRNETVHADAEQTPVQPSQAPSWSVSLTPSDLNAPLTPGWQFESQRLWTYLFASTPGSSWQKNWHVLLGTSACWFFLDFAFPSTLSSFWLTQPATIPPNEAWWASSADVSAQTPQAFHRALQHNMIHGLESSTAAALAGSLLYVACARHVNRRQMLIATFATLGACW
ncbi:hypothetical protein MRB53_037728 [Persea americana]|nr:hypothetical protein MRB53_037728 [Persea americana]